MRAIAQQAVDLTTTTLAFDPQQRGLRQLLDYRQLRGRLGGQAAQRLLGLTQIGRQAIALDRTFAGLVAQGIGLWLGVQAFINIGVATGLPPTKGLTLPLMSYGGSALLSTLTALGILLRVDYENRKLMRGGRA